MDIFKITDKTGRKIRLTNKQWKHIQEHPHMHESLEKIKEVIKNPLTIRKGEFDNKVNYFYKEYKEMSPKERYLFISVKYLNGDGFVITAFYTNKITGLK
ncbi:MAG: PBECR2 nuclease fold domain-containing protein [Candidatus Pacearchaeota archaeon]